MMGNILVAIGTMVYSKMGRKKEAEALIAEEFKVVSEILAGKRSWGSWPQFAGMYYVLAIDNAYMGNSDKAVQYLDSAFHYHFYWPWGGYGKDPLFFSLRDRADFKKLVKKVDDREEFMKRAYSNALNRMEASKELKNSLK